MGSKLDEYVAARTAHEELLELVGRVAGVEVQGESHGESYLVDVRNLDAEGAVVVPIPRLVENVVDVIGQFRTQLLAAAVAKSEEKVQALADEARAEAEDVLDELGDNLRSDL